MIFYQRWQSIPLEQFCDQSGVCQRLLSFLLVSSKSHDRFATIFFLSTSSLAVTNYSRRNFGVQNEKVQRILIFLVVLVPSHVQGSFTENLTLHVDSVFSDQSHTSFTSSDSACSGSLSVSLGVSGKQLVGLSGFGHFGKCVKEIVWKDGDEENDLSECCTMGNK